ncbi:acyl-CoA thioesterase [Egicoccus sp. AB-alg6-2]|uniref:acyl-CoA thioesterase n=1 Tax=Egicoccus sp. AB-alg6-2 TaxID=3242692 RepID=UPI00359DFE33
MSTTTTIRVRFHELDPNGHVNHGVYANYFETARIELLDGLGFGPGVLAARGVHLVVVELRIHFRRPAHAGQTLTVRTWVEELRRASSWWAQQIVDETGQIVAEAEVRSTATNPAGRPIPPPPELAEKLATLQA